MDKIQSVFTLIIIAGKIQLLKSEERVAMYSLSPPVSDMVGSPYLTTEMPIPQSSRSRNGMTFCSWISPTYFRRPSVVFSVKDDDTDMWEISLGILPTGVLLRRKEESVVTQGEILPLTMNHFCVSVSSRTLSLFQDGVLIHTSSFQGSELLGQNLKIFVGGGEQWPNMTPRTVGLPYVNDNSFVLRSIPRGSFAGLIIGPTIWEHDLTVKEIAKLSQCESLNKFSFETSWMSEGVNLEESTIGLKEPCAEERFRYLFLSKALPFDENNVICQRLQLELFSPTEHKDYTRLIDDVKPFHETCGKEKWYTWVQPLNDVSEQSQQPIDRCEALTVSGQESLSCEEHLCSGCQFEREKLFVLRGICPVDKIEFSFIIRKNAEKLGFYFYGLERHNISQNGESWVLKDEASDLILASTTASLDPVGVREWTIQRELCDKKKDQVVRASLSSCDTNEALCSDGSCIPFSKRCDGYPDCFDASDELECDSIRTSNHYFSQSPPLPSPAQVQVCISIIRVLSMLPENYFTLLLETKYSWSDRRLNVANLHPGTISTLPKNSNLWRPKLSVLSPGKPYPLEMGGGGEEPGKRAFASAKIEGTTLTAITLSKPLLDTRETPFKDTLYSGANTTFAMRELVTQNVDCDFDFSFFPFDEQICKISFVMSTWPSSRLVLKSPLIGRYIGPARLLHYTVAQTKTEAKSVKINGKAYSGIDLSIHLTRRPSLYVLSVYLPSVILLLINCSTLWMVCLQSTLARVQISCVILIAFTLDWVLLTLNAPQTQRLTAIDVWLCFCTTLALLHVLVHVLLDVFTDENQPDPFSRISSRVNSSRLRGVKPIDAHSLYDGILMKMTQLESRRMWSVPYWILFIARVVSPVILLFFNGTYWPFVLYFRKNELP